MLKPPNQIWQDFAAARMDLLESLRLDPTHDSAKKCLKTMDEMIQVSTATNLTNDAAASS